MPIPDRDVGEVDILAEHLFYSEAWV